MSHLYAKVGFFAIFLTLTTYDARATEEKFQFDDPAQSALFIELTHDLRCPQCQNQNIADSNAMIAIDLKRKVYQLLQEGNSEEQVVDYMRQRYGDFVYYQPPVNSMTIWLWLLPLIFVFGGIVLVYVSRQKKPAEIDQGQLAQAEKLLERDE
jgi:cytochrome c-type biogenesis protein CcmH